MIAAKHLVAAIAPKRADRSWIEQAACTSPGVDPDVFFPDAANQSSPAKHLCAACPVWKECQNAFDRAEKYSKTAWGLHGVVGGETPLERVARRRTERTAQAIAESMETELIRCVGCQKLMRPHRTHKEDFPGTIMVQNAAKKLCVTCTKKRKAFR